MVDSEASVANKPRLVRSLAVVVGLSVVLLLSVLAFSDSATDNVADSPLIGRNAPNVGGTTIDGEEVRLSDFRGKYVVLNFFATWCVPCRQEHSEFLKFTGRHDSTGDATVLMAIFDDQPNNVKEYFQRYGGNWDVIDDPSGKIALEFGVRGPPESFLIDRNGVVVNRIVGQITDDGLQKLLDDANRSGGRN